MELEGGAMRNDSEFKSIISAYITGMLQEKRSNGYLYDSEERILKRFDRYCVDNGLDKTEISKVFLGKWMERTETEGNFNQGKRISVVRQLLFTRYPNIQIKGRAKFSHCKRYLAKWV